MTDETQNEEVRQGRRGFLKMAAVAPAAAAATVAGTEGAEAATGPQKGLADTEQTRAYYASARF
ncbi:twin-arginine translocation signal domain-containing protein [Jannaschia sp. S6380]|uniref:twin-arginine translocation signal domain-containing protein n=1 Tax=Jannaschia sp. S6380 TaxID=2926408 RepID=UPI001FF4B87C|nr:twin-arginine translocation signal domain-containing protein [Jannaschia sp. S6380]MCK0168335.1 twin-arginine translocation signal domain-containing protein [Jannaschia sp. S6380]